jgi:hypothetical protein
MLSNVIQIMFGRVDSLAAMDSKTRFYIIYSTKRPYRPPVLRVGSEPALVLYRLTCYDSAGSVR